ncbi:MAG TPA: RICIN domain-containing protein [Vicinamibacterales bacterium]|nr:RICIN domain-containing protein [Vicinamibacterales bacterium]
MKALTGKLALAGASVIAWAVTITPLVAGQRSAAETRAIHRCEDELQFAISQDTSGRAPEAIIDTRRATVTQRSQTVLEITGPARYVRDGADRGRALTFRCSVDMRTGRATATYQWTGGSVFDPEYDNPGYPAWPSGGYRPEGRIYFSGGIVGKGSNRGLDVENRSKRNQANIQIWDFNGAPNQMWDIVDLGRGEYSLVSQGSNRVLDVLGNADGANVVQNRWHGGDNQRWRLVRAGGGFFQIANVGSDKCLDVRDKGTENGADVQQWSCSIQDNQLWRLVRNPGGYSDLSASAGSTAVARRSGG